MSVNIVHSLEGQGRPQSLQRYKMFLTGSVARGDIKNEQILESFHPLLEMQSDVLILQMDSVTQACTTQSCHCKLNISTFVVNDVGNCSI